MVQIYIKDLSKSFLYKDKILKVLNNINLKINDGEFLVIFGPNGAGKTTFLNILGGIEDADKGDIKVDGKSVDETKIGFVFQNYHESLLPWRTILKNVELPIERTIKNTSTREKIAKQCLRDVGLLNFSNKYPYQLSGGMKQLVAIARSMAYDPDFLLLDEPFSALDYDNRIKMEEKLLWLWSKKKKTIIFVSHDIDEAVFLADKIVVFSKRPASVKAIINVKLKRPRTVDTRLKKEFFEIKNRVLKVFKDEVA